MNDVTDAGKVRKGRDEALALAKTASVIHVAKGQNVVTIDMKHAPDDDALAELLLGRSGNLRAPTLRRGKTLYVGFNADIYAGLQSRKEPRTE